MNPGARFETGNTSQILKLGSNDHTVLESKDSDAIDHCCVSKIRPSEANGFFVYTRRNKNQKRRSIGGLDSEVAVITNDGMDHFYSSRIRPSEANGFFVYTRRNKNRKRRNQSSSIAVSDSEVAVNAREADGYAGDVEGEDNLIEVEVKEDPMLVRASAATRRFTESVNRLDDSDDVEGNEESENEMKMSKKRPSTVRELFKTGLLEGYPVFYNGGKKGLPLHGTIKGAGIECSCSICMGIKVVPPFKFEIHACKSYRRASQYICFKNGKSLLDVVKECRKTSVKTLKETIENFIGPLPVNESAICLICERSFRATSAATVELLCDSCMVAECVKSRPLDPLLGSTMSENGEVRNTLQKEGCSGRKKRKHAELTSRTKSSGKSSLRLSTRKEGQWKTPNLLSPPTSGTKSPRSLMKDTNSSSDSTSNRSASSCGSRKSRTRKILKRMSNTTLPNSLKKGSPPVSVQSKTTQKDQRMHKLIFKEGGLEDGAEVFYYSHGKIVRGAYKKGSGLMCSCCDTQVSPSQFEAHCGWASRRKPYMYIYTSDGVSLHELAVSLLNGEKYTSRTKSDLCIICADGGKLARCDGCPRAFHTECASLSSLPCGKWLCTYCQNVPEKETLDQGNANAVAAGASGIDPLAHTTNRCMHVVKNPEETEIIACVLCRGYDYSTTGFGPRTVILCDQCEKEYHVGCLKKSKMAHLKELPQGKWFCSISCKQIYSTLKGVLDDGEEKIPDFSLDVLKQMEKSLVADTAFDVKWRLLNGKIQTRETKGLLSQAVAIFHGSFDPIVDLETGRDIIPSLVYGRNVRGQDFSGLYCAILMVNSKVVSAAMLRIFGEDLAELPLAATRTGDQGKGYFQILYTCIEKLLAFLSVKDIVLPSTSEAMSLWTKKFGYSKLPEEQLSHYRKVCWQMISFKGTSILGKPVPKCRIINQDEDDSDVPFQ